jgi:hypothetical protein
VAIETDTSDERRENYAQLGEHLTCHIKQKRNAVSHPYSRLALFAVPDRLACTGKDSDRGVAFSSAAIWW